MLNSVFCSSHCWLSIVPHYTLPFLSFKKRVMFFWFVIYFFLIDSREVYSVCIKVFFFFFFPPLLFRKQKSCEFCDDRSFVQFSNSKEIMWYFVTGYQMNMVKITFPQLRFRVRALGQEPDLCKFISRIAAVLIHV